MNNVNLFLTTIPKSGTHLLTDFLKKVGMHRHTFGEYKLVENIELLFFHHHKAEYEMAMHTRLNEDYDHSLASSAECLRQIPDHGYAFYHVPHEPKLVSLLRDESIPMVFLLRDPRDVVISLTNHVVRRPDSTKYQRLAALPTDEDRYLSIIPGCSKIFERYERWLSEPDVLILRYEDIIGPRGGGDQIKQYESYTKLCRHIGLDISEKRIRRVVDSIYSESAPFFVKGKIGQWQEKFTPQIEKELNKHMGEVLHLWLS